MTFHPESKSVLHTIFRQRLFLTFLTSAIAIALVSIAIAGLVFHLCYVTRRKSSSSSASHTSESTESTAVYNEVRHSYLDEDEDVVNDSWNWNLSTLVREIGRGFYGRVYLVKDERDRAVAVKTLDNKDDNELGSRVFNNEIDVLSTLHVHENVIRLLGYNRGLEIIVLEFCRHGNLRDYIVSNRDTFIDEVDAKTGEISADLNLTYVTSSTMMTSSSSLFNTRRLLKWSNQIAIGMRYLESQKIVHGDLALRNALLTETDVVKISDFGLSSTSSELNNVKSLTDVDFIEITKLIQPVPVAWMPVEYFKSKCKGTHQADVWAYGVTLYEIFSLGRKPYEEELVPLDQIGDFIMKGGRLDLPERAPKSFQTLITSCWNEIPELRPDFDSIVQSFHLLLDYKCNRRKKRNPDVVERSEIHGYVPMSSRGNTPPIANDYVYWKGYKIMNSNASMTN